MNSFKINPMIATDSYKLSHKDMYPEGTAMVYSNMTPRSGKILQKIVPVSIYDDKMVHYGIQGLLMHYVGLWNENFFGVSQTDAVSWYARTVPPFMGATEVTVDHVVALHKLGYLPLLVRSLPEGSIVPFKVPVFTVENTLHNFYWLTNYTETYFSNEYWKGTTVATIARYYRILLEKYAIETGCPLDFVDFQGHDFSCRGMSGMHDSATAGSGHLVYFKGSDTLLAVDYSRYAYDADKEPLIACSVPATEHSVMTSSGKEGEFELFKRIITKVVPNGIVSVVSDSFDFWQVMTDFTVRLKDDILARGKDPITGLSKVVFRPDSDDPVKIVCGTGCLTFDTLTEAIEEINEMHYAQANEDCEGAHNVGCEFYETVAKVGDEYYKFKTCFEYNRHDKTYYYIDNYGGAGETKFEEVQPTPEMKGAIECLWDVFGGTINEKGYKVLSDRVGLIYGDSITLERAEAILEGLKSKGFCTSCIVFGIGSFTYQYMTRDTLGLAIKATYRYDKDGNEYELFKDPKTDSGTKKSAKGLLQVIKNDKGDFELKDQVTYVDTYKSELQPIFIDGKFVNKTNLTEIRDRAKVRM